MWCERTNTIFAGNEEGYFHFAARNDDVIVSSGYNIAGPEVEAALFAAQAIAVCRALELDPFADHINPNGGAVALRHPLGMTGARLVGTASLELSVSGKSSALCSLCVVFEQGVSLALGRP